MESFSTKRNISLEEFREVEVKLHRFETALEYLSDGIYITDENTVAIYVNKAYEKISSTSRKEFLGKTIYKVIEENLIDSSGTIKAIEKGMQVTMNQVLNNGKIALITSTPIFNKKNNIEYIVTIVRDITELMYLKNKLVKKEMELKTLKKSNDISKDIIYKSKKMEILLDKLTKVAKYDTTIFLKGETGVGKSLIAKFIHNNSNRKHEKFLELNCASIPRSLIESELFGYEEGSFTGASKKGKKGIFEQANGGTLFLDEIGEMPIDMQPKLLTVLQEKKVRPIGSLEEIKIDIRIITATNKNISEMINNKLFREDLYYRLNVIPIEIYPLRERPMDIIPLSIYFINKLKEKYGKEIYLNNKIIDILMDYSWPGNIRELENVIERLFVTSDNTYVSIENLPKEIIKNSNMDKNREFTTLKEATFEVEARLIEKAFLEKGNVKEASKLLGISSSTFVRKRKKYKEKGLIKE